MDILNRDVNTTQRAAEELAPTCTSPNLARATRTLAFVTLLAAQAQVSAQAGDAGAPPGPAPASEEGTGLNVTLVRAGGEDFSDQKRFGTPLGLAACVEGSIEVMISGLPGSPAYPYLEVWEGTGAGACNQGDRGTRVTSSQNCTQLASDRDGEPLGGAERLNTTVQIAPICDLNAEQTTGAKQGPQTLWFLLLREPGSAEPAMFYRAITINIDTVAPEAPTQVTAGSGASDIPVTWDDAPSAANYWVIADPSERMLAADQGDAGAAANGCKSRYLRAGQAFDPDAAEAAGLLMRETTETMISFDSDDFAGAQRVPVAVVAQDLASNLSVLSEVRCMTVTDGDSSTTAAEERDGSSGTTDEGCSCSAPGAHASTARSALAALPFGFLLVGAYARRRACRMRHGVPRQVLFSAKVTPPTKE